MEWLVLVLLVPAIVVPIVLLFGFAGCGATVGFGARTPTIVSVIPLLTEPRSAAFRWDDTNGGPVSFQLERRRGSDPPLPPREIESQSPPGSPLVFLDGPLEDGTAYTYRIRALRLSDGDFSPWSDEATIETWARAFTADLVTAGITEVIPGGCVVQRLVPGTLDRPGNLIGLTVRGAPEGDVVLTTTTISRPAAVGNAFDSAAKPVIMTNTPGTVPAGSASRLALAEFNVGDEALLFAFDVDDPGNARRLSGPPQTAYLKRAPPGVRITEAAAQNRAAFEERPDELWFIEAIDVATMWPPVVVERPHD
jgi:hypothetical protein